MGTKNRETEALGETEPPLMRRLLDPKQSHLFSFFQAVFLLQHYAASVGRFLFRVDAACCDSLDINQLPEALRQEFEFSGISLSDRLTVSVETPGQEWLITDTSSSKFYPIRRRGDVLNVYARTNTRVGHDGPVALEAVRFRPDVSLAFPVSDIVSIESISTKDDPLPRFRLTTSFLGLYGSDSPLPDFYTEDILKADEDESYTRDFLDLFHHRLLSLLYRCWLKYRHYLQFDSTGEDDFSNHMLSFIGIDTPTLAAAGDFSPLRLVRYAGLIAQQCRSAAALEGLLSDYFGGIPVHIEQCIGQWVTIAPEDRMVLGGGNCELGVNFTIGNRVFDAAGKFRISLGPMTYTEYVQFLPKGTGLETLCNIVRFYLVDALEFEIELVLRPDEVPRMELPVFSGVTPHATPGVTLGRTSWLLSHQPQDSVAVVFDV